MRIVAISIVKCLLNTFIFVYVHKTDSIQTRYISLLVAVVSITDFKDFVYLKFFLLVHLINALCTWGICLAEYENDCFYIHIMLFIFHSKEHITVNGVFVVLFEYLNVFRSAMK